MLKKSALSALSVLFSISLASASDFGLNSGSLNIKERVSGIEIPAPRAPAAESGFSRAPLKEWTVMVYINGKNNLESFALKDLNEMEMVGSSDKLNIVVEIGRISYINNGSDNDWQGTRRYLVNKDNNDNSLGSALVEDMGMVDMGDYRNLSAFGRWAKENYPAKKYMLIVWNHGSGWDKSAGGRVSKGISYDDETGNHISTPQLGQALKEMGKVDVYGSDACLMQMAEVDYELKDYADYIVGSEETEPADGYTYNDFLAPVAVRPEISPAELAKAAVDAYSDHYQWNTGSTQSFIKTAALPDLVENVNAWVDAVMAAGLKTEVAAARSEAISYANPSNRDLYNFVNLVSEKTQNAAVMERSAALMDFISNDLVMYNRTPISLARRGVMIITVMVMAKL